MRAFLILLALTMPALAATDDPISGMDVTSTGCECWDRTGGPMVKWACRKALDYTASAACPLAGRRILSCPVNTAETCVFILSICEKPPTLNACWPADKNRR